MTVPRRVPDLFTVLVEASERALLNTQFEDAFYALSAALRYAQDFEQLERIDQIETIALEQLAYINAKAPKTIITMPVAVARNGVDLYAMLARNAKTCAQMIRDNQRRVKLSK